MRGRDSEKEIGKRKEGRRDMDYPAPVMMATCPARRPAGWVAEAERWLTRTATRLAATEDMFVV